MFECFNNAVITKINLAMYVAPGVGINHHTNRASHGLVINDSNSDKDYIFSDGTVLKTKAFGVFYLPKGSTYHIEDLKKSSACWAINFDLLEEINEKPFVIHFKSNDTILENFKESVSVFKKQADDRDLVIRKNLYEIILKIQRESQKNYVPNRKKQQIEPAINYINRHLENPNLSVKRLSVLCGISENYLRRIFAAEFKTSPKEYIINRRIEYAKTLLKSGQFSVSKVGEMCGYTEPCHFSRDFSKRAGVSPKSYSMNNP